MSANYGALSGNKFKTAVEASYDPDGKLTEAGHAKFKEIFNTILVREISKTYKTPNAVSTARLSLHFFYVYFRLFRHSTSVATITLPLTIS